MSEASDEVVEISGMTRQNKDVDSVCQTLASLPKMRALHISENYALGTETGGKELGKLLKENEELKDLLLFSLRLSHECVEAVTEALKSSSATVERLSIYDTFLYINARNIQCFADLLAANTSISGFTVGVHDPGCVIDDPAVLTAMMKNPTALEREAQIQEEEQSGMNFAQALQRNSSLKILALNLPNRLFGGAANMVSALGSNSTLEELYISNIKSWGKAGLTLLFRALTPVPPDSSKVCLKLLHLEQNEGMRGWFKEENLPEADVTAAMISHNRSLDVLEFRDGYSEASWLNIIVPALASNSTLVRLQRFANPWTFHRGRNNNNSLDSVPVFGSGLKENKSGGVCYFSCGAVYLRNVLSNGTSCWMVGIDPKHRRH